MRNGRIPFLVCLGLCVLVATAAAAAEPEFALRKLEWVGPPSGEPHTVDVYNPYGDIHLRRSESTEIVVSGVVQVLAAGQPQARLAVSPKAGTTSVRLELSEQRETYPGRVDLVVLLPAGVDVDARTREGAIWIKSIRGRVTARSATGKIMAVFKKLTGDGRDSEIVLETETGDIEANFLVDTDLRVHATTGGVIQTQIPNDLVHGIREYRGILTGALGSGRTPVTIRSVSGTVALQLPNANVSEPADGGKE